MKSIRLTILAALVGLLSGCISLKKLDSQIPNGRWEQARVEAVGEVVKAEINATGRKVDGEWVEGEIHGEYNGFWLKKLRVDLKAKKEE